MISEHLASKYECSMIAFAGFMCLFLLSDRFLSSTAPFEMTFQFLLHYHATDLRCPDGQTRKTARNLPRSHLLSSLFLIQGFSWLIIAFGTDALVLTAFARL